MKKIIFTFILVLFCVSSSVLAGPNRDARIKYVLSNLNLDEATQKKMWPLLEQYLKEKKEETSAYEDKKDALKLRIKSDKLTDAQANELMRLHWIADEKEVKLKRAWEPKFKAVIGAAKTYKCFDLLNDKKEKFLKK